MSCCCSLWVSALILFSSSVVYCAIQVPSAMVRSVGQDAIFQWNSTNEIWAAEWGIKHPSRHDFLQKFIFTDKFVPAVVQISVAKSPYKGRVSFIGNLSVGHAWFKLANLTLGDSNYYSANIREASAIVEVFSSLYLKVIDVMPNFIKVPPSILFVPLGQAVKFVWDYATGNKTTEFDPQSPRWEVYDNKVGWKTIGADHAISGWKWKLSLSCPARLQNPTRVSKASSASLIIYNVTREDSGLYRCNLTLRHRPPITSSVRLIVTARPQFSSRPSSTVNIAEGQHLQILCSAVGPPVPNVTWVHIENGAMVTITKGVGNASLTLPNIKRDQNGIYKCQAVNNHNQSPVSTETKINVMYPPRIDYSMSDTTVISVPGVATRLRCVVSGFPIPNVTWYNINRQLIKHNVTSYVGIRKVFIDIENAKENGNYRCFAENILGYIEHNVTVVPNKCNAEYHEVKSKETIDYARDPVFITCVVIIAVLIVVTLICALLIMKLRHNRGNNTKKRDSIQEVIVNMSQIPNPIPSPTSANNEMPSNTHQAGDLDYDQPVEESTESAARHSDTSYPYDEPEIAIAINARASVSPPNLYQELRLVETSNRDYQSLRGIRSAAANPCSETEISRAYEPLKKCEPQYQQIIR